MNEIHASHPQARHNSHNSLPMIQLRQEMNLLPFGSPFRRMEQNVPPWCALRTLHPRQDPPLQTIPLDFSRQSMPFNLQQPSRLPAIAAGVQQRPQDQFSLRFLQ